MGLRWAMSFLIAAAALVAALLGSAALTQSPPERR
jgi:hypothetical protein